MPTRTFGSAGDLELVSKLMISVEEVEADKGAGEGEEGLMEGGPALVADGEAAIAGEPGQRAFDDPPVPAQLRAGVDATAGDTDLDVAGAQHLATAREVVRLISVEPVRAFPRAPRVSCGTADGRHRIHQHGELGGVVPVGGAEVGYQGHTVTVHDQVAFGPWFPPVGRVWPDLFSGGAPLFAGTLALSRLARAQSIRSARPSRSSNVRCSRSQTPASCQSRSRRQHVLPLPQPISTGSSCHWMPVFKTNTMPASAARSGTRGRPPFGLGRSGGSNCATTSHNASLTNGLLMHPHSSSTVPRF